MSTIARIEGEARAQDISRKLVLWISLLMVAGVALYGVLMVSDFNRLLGPELDRRAALIGETISNDTERAVALGIPLEGFVGVDPYLGSFLSEFPELDYLAIRSADGDVLYSAYAHGVEEDGVAESVVYGFAIDAEDGKVGSIDVGVDRHFVRSRLQDLALDVGVILIVALVVVFETTLALSERIVGRRSRRVRHAAVSAAQRGSAGDIRLVLFLFALGEELSKSFLPLLIQAADNPIPGLDPNIVISLPIIAYLLTLAVASPLAGRLVDAFGQRGLFLVGLAFAASSHLGMVFADNVVQIMGLRALTGIGYGLATIACQEYLLRRMAPGRRAKTIGVFVAVIIGGTFAGTALGGILADRLGYDTVFVISFFVVLGSGLLALTMMQPGAGSGERARAVSLRDMTTVMRRPAAVLLLGGVTIPMNVLMAAFLWYLVPLTMAAAGSGASSIARTLMIYYLVILIGGPLVGKAADRLHSLWLLVGIGSVLAGAALLLPALLPSTLTVSIAVLLVGVGHATVRGPQVALALDIADAEGEESSRDSILAAMRALERLGSLLGLLVVSLLAAGFGLNVAVGAIGVTTAVAAIVFLIARLSSTPRWAT